LLSDFFWEEEFANQVALNTSHCNGFPDYELEVGCGDHEYKFAGVSLEGLIGSECPLQQTLAS
jgi:hypothetical protein